MPEDACPVRWTGQQAVVTLPRHIDTANAGQIRERLLGVVNRGAEVLVADLAGTVSCDYSGADALARAHHRAVANGTELRLVVTADAVRRVLSVSGLDRLVSVHSDLAGAVAAGAEPQEVHGEQRTGAADQVARAEELLDSVVHDMFCVGLMLQAAADLPRDVIAERITEALHHLGDVIREVRNYAFAERSQGSWPGLAWKPPPYPVEPSAPARNRSVLLRQRVAQTAHVLHFAAADTAALLERQADLPGQSPRIDYPAEIELWRAFADQARQMAESWEQRP